MFCLYMFLFFSLTFFFLLSLHYLSFYLSLHSLYFLSNTSYPLSLLSLFIFYLLIFFPTLCINIYQLQATVYSFIGNQFRKCKEELPLISWPPSYIGQILRPRNNVAYRIYKKESLVWWSLWLSSKKNFPFIGLV